MADLRDLDPLSKQLNNATEELNLALQTIENKLNALGIGLEVWVVDDLVEVTNWSDLLDENQEPTGSRWRYVTQLGYGRHGDGWALLTRRVEQREGSDARGFSSVDEYDEHSSVKPLLRASRDHRSRAVDLVPELINQVEAAAKRMIARVAQAKKIADSLK